MANVRLSPAAASYAPCRPSRARWRTVSILRCTFGRQPAKAKPRVKLHAPHNAGHATSSSWACTAAAAGPMQQASSCDLTQNPSSSLPAETSQPAPRSCCTRHVPLTRRLQIEFRRRGGEAWRLTCDGGGGGHLIHMSKEPKPSLLAADSSAAASAAWIKPGAQGSVAKV
jgi:hypothetical protein